MKWTRRILRGLLVVLVGVIALALWPIGRAEYDSWSLGQAVERGPGTMIDLADFGPSDWERVYVFTPYTPHESIQAMLGFSWRGVTQTQIDMQDGITLVVFVRAGGVARWFEHPMKRGDLSELANGVGHARTEARFVVQRDAEGRAILTVP